MPAPNNSTAQAQIAIMLQVVEENIETAQNLDQGIDRRFQKATARDMGKEKYRHPIEFDVGGQFAGNDPDGGPYITGNGPGYNQFIVVPVSGLIAIARTELLQRIEGAGTDRLTIAKPIARMLAKVKDKFAHTRNALAQGYNQGLLGVIDASYAGGVVVQMANVPYGNRLLDLNNAYQLTDANFNVLGQVTILAKSNSTGGGIDTVTLDNVPVGTAAGCQFIPLNYASAAPLGPQGLQYLISNSQVGDNCGISRTVAYVQSPSVNASSTLTLGIIEVMNQRQNQALGSDQAQEKRFYYTHYVQRATARLLGFAKTSFMVTDAKVQQPDIAAPRNAPWMIGNQEVLTDSMAGVDKLYDIAEGQLRKVRYPGSQRMIPGPLDGIWWFRTVGGQATSESDALFQDAYNLYTKLPWAHVYTYNLYVNPVMAAGT
jgi:hypothetical protein